MKSSPQEQSRIEKTLKLHNMKNTELYSSQEENMEKKVPDDMHLYSTKYSLFESILHLIKVKQIGHKHNFPVKVSIAGIPLAWIIAF